MKKDILILHGWGLNESKYENLQKQFDHTKYRVYCVDLPGFGEEPLDNKLNLGDYVEFVHSFLQTHHIKSVILIGHSFGGRIATKFAYKYPNLVESLILTGVPIIRHMTLKKRVARVVAYGGGIVLDIFPENIQQLFRKILYKSIGEYDYLKAGQLKEVFKNVINEDLTMYAQSIKKPVLLIWGATDSFTPSSDVGKIQQLIPHARAVVVPGIGHRLPYSNPELFYKEIESFI